MSKYDYIVYTDGACLGNPGPGGWAAIIVDRNGEERTLSGSAILTTNNRMELRAALEALRSLPSDKSIKVLLRTDSALLANALSKGWAQRWRSQRWRRSSRERVENVDLWHPLLEEMDKRSIAVEWTKAHNGDVLNERCDSIARSQAEHPNGIDDGYTQRRATALEDLPLALTQEGISTLQCWRSEGNNIMITDGQTTLRIPIDQIPTLFEQIATAILQR